MARRTFGGTAADIVTDSAGNFTVDSGTVWTAQSGGTQITDLLDMNGNPLSGGVVVTGGNPVGLVQFQGPNDGTNEVWADFGGGRVRLVAHDGKASLGNDGKVSAAVVPDLSGSYEPLRYFNVRAAAYGATGDGTTNDRAAIQAAIDAADAAGGGVVFLPKGTYRVPSSASPLAPKSGVILRGVGADSVLYHDSTDDLSTNNLIEHTTNPGPSNWGIENMTLRGSRGPGHYTILPGGPQLVYVSYVDRATFRNVRIEHARYGGMVILSSDDVLVEGCDFYKVNADGCRMIDTPNLRIVNNNFRFVNDDCIAVHATDAAPNPIRSGIVISNNTASDSQGIKVLGAKSLTVTGNVLRRMMSFGLYVGSDIGEGNTAAHSVVIANNTIQDVFLRQESPPLNGLQAYMYLGDFPREGTTAALAPGLNNTATGAIVSPFGSTTGSMYSKTSTDQPGAYNWIITGNVLTRTLPAVTTWSEWGYGSALEVGEQGTYNGAIPDSVLKTRSVRIEPFMRNVLFANNILSTGGDGCLFFAEPGGGSTDREYDGFVIEGNLFSDWSDFALYWQSATTTYQNIVVRGNKFDGDPRFVHSNRGANGTWAAQSTPLAAYVNGARGFVFEGNDIRNVCQVLSGGASFGDYTFIKGNLLRGDPAVSGFSTSNKGIGLMPLNGAAYTALIEGSDPTAADFRETKNACLTEAASIPTTGKYVRGHVVVNNTPTLSASKTALVVPNA